jgi:hypothetical protein
MKEATATYPDAPADSVDVEAERHDLLPFPTRSPACPTVRGLQGEPFVVARSSATSGCRGSACGDGSSARNGISSASQRFLHARSSVESISLRAHATIRAHDRL